MHRFTRAHALGSSFLILMCAGYDADAPFPLRLASEASAIIGYAPGGSVVRRRAIIGTTAVVASTSATASAAASANATAAANANAAAANANAAAAAAVAAGPPPLGTMVTTLPPGCTPTKLNGIDYERCGSTYYRAQMQGSIVVFEVVQP